MAAKKNPSNASDAEQTGGDGAATRRKPTKAVSQEATKAAEAEPAGEDTIILPIGHYVGAYFPGPDEPLQHHTVRVGQTPVRLRSDDEFGIWALAHGFSGEDAVRPWTRQHIVAVAREAGLDNAPEIVADLLAEDVLAEVTMNTQDSVEFAMAYRPAPLMFGVGVTREEPVAVGIGLQGQPAVETSSYGFELWRFGHRAGSLWEFGRIQGELLRDEAGMSETETAPEQMLLHTFWELQALLASNVVYLDLAGNE